MEKLTNVQQKQLVAVRLSQDATVLSLSRNDFKNASESLTTRIEKTFDLPKIWEIKQATSENTVQAFIEFELIKLAESINVSGNLTDAQISAIARTIVESYPNETIADFKICFAKAARGEYGKVWKLDGIEVGIWIKTYLDQKYQILEDELYRQKDNYRNEVFKQVRSDSDWIQLWKESVEEADKECIKKSESMNISVLRNSMAALTDKQINEEGKERPKQIIYPSTSLSELQKKELHFQYIQENYDPRTGDKLPTWVEEKQWLEMIGL